MTARDQVARDRAATATREAIMNAILEIRSPFESASSGRLGQPCRGTRLLLPLALALALVAGGLPSTAGAADDAPAASTSASAMQKMMKDMGKLNEIDIAKLGIFLLWPVGVPLYLLWARRLRGLAVLLYVL